MIHYGGYIRKNYHQENGFNMILDTRKGNCASMMFYLKAKRYFPEDVRPQEEKRNLIEEKNMEFTIKKIGKRS